MVVVGLAGFASQTAVLPQCRGWDYVQKDLLEAPHDDADSVIIDSAVQPAGYYDSRPRPATAKQNTPARAAKPSPTNGALYRGQKVKMPSSLPFSRPTPQSNSAQRSPYAQAPAAAVRGAGGTQARNPQAYSNSTAAMQHVPSGTPARAPAGMNANHTSAPQTAAWPAQPVRPTAAPHVAAAPHATTKGLPQAPAARPAPNTSNVAPWTNKPAATPAAKPAGMRAAAVAPAAAPSSPADQLIIKAYEASAQAQSQADYTEVIATCRRALTGDASPDAQQYANNLIAWSLNRRGQLKAESGSDKEAILDFDDAIRTDANCWRAIHNRGVLLAQAGQFEKAFDDFTRAIKLNPNHAKAYSNRAALYMVANNLEAARDDYKQAVELDSNLAVAHRGYGRVCQLTGNIEAAIAHYDAAVQLAPDDSYAAACRADLLTDIGRYAEAADEYDRALALDSKSSQAQSGLAWLLATCPDSAVRNPAIAIEQARAVIANNGDREAVNFDTLAAAQASAGDFASAMDSVRKAIELAPVDERDAYRDRLNLYQKAKPYRIAPIERMAQQVSYEETTGVEGAAR